jgi:hypothetical protein
MENTKQQVETVESASTEKNEQKAPVNILLGAISYNNESDYETFLENMDINQALFIIVSGCTYAQSKAAYNLAEAELISKAIKTIKNQSTKPAESKASTDESNDTAEA